MSFSDAPCTPEERNGPWWIQVQGFLLAQVFELSYCTLQTRVIKRDTPPICIHFWTLVHHSLIFPRDGRYLYLPHTLYLYLSHTHEHKLNSAHVCARAVPILTRYCDTNIQSDTLLAVCVIGYLVYIKNVHSTCILLCSSKIKCMRGCKDVRAAWLWTKW